MSINYQNGINYNSTTTAPLTNYTSPTTAPLTNYSHGNIDFNPILDNRTKKFLSLIADKLGLMNYDDFMMLEENEVEGYIKSLNRSDMIKDVLENE